jgi:hypothetical protein
MEKKESRVDRTIAAPANSVSLLSCAESTTMAGEVGQCKEIAFPPGRTAAMRGKHARNSQPATGKAQQLHGTEPKQRMVAG